MTPDTGCPSHIKFLLTKQHFDLCLAFHDRVAVKSLVSSGWQRILRQAFQAVAVVRGLLESRGTRKCFKVQIPKGILLDCFPESFFNHNKICRRHMMNTMVKFLLIARFTRVTMRITLMTDRCSDGCFRGCKLHFVGSAERGPALLTCLDLLFGFLAFRSLIGLDGLAG